MVLSRLCQPLCYRAHSLHRLRHLSFSISSPSITRFHVPKALSKNENGNLLRFVSVHFALVKGLAEKARAGKLKPNEFQGGTFSISNLGMYPVDHFCAIINPPQAGIHAVGRGNKVVTPVVGINGTEELSVVTKMSLTLSAYHRVFDGKVGGKFLEALRANFCDMRKLLL